MNQPLPDRTMAALCEALALIVERQHNTEYRESDKDADARTTQVSTTLFGLAEEWREKP